MPKHSFFLKMLLFIAFVGFSGNLLAAKENKIKIAVLDFKTTGGATDIGEGTAEQLRAALMETGKYTVVEHDMLKDALEEQKLAPGGVVTQTMAVAIGKSLGVKLVAVGSVVKIDNSYTLNVRFVDVATGEVLFGKRLTAQSSAEIPELCSQIVEILVQKEPAQVQEEEQSQLQSVIKPRKTEAPDSESIKGLINLGINYPGAGLRYFFSNSSALELRGQSEKDITIGGVRLYLFPGLFKRSGVIPYWGIEGDYGSFKGEYSKGNGYAGGGFAGLECFMGKSASLQADGGASYVSLKDKTTALTQSGTEFTINFGFNIYF